MNTEATNESNSEAAIDDPKRAERIKDEVRISFYPKIIFLLPTLIYCVLAACYLELAGTDGSPTSTQAQTVEATTESSENVEVTKEVVESNTPEATVTIIFMFVFTLNLVVMAFDFPSNRFLALIAFVFLAMAGLWILSEKNPELMGGLSDFISSIKPAANGAFFWTMSIMLGILFLIMFFARKLDYWVIKPNEAIHYHGLPQHSKRYSAHHMRFEMEVNDIFEHLWPFKAGRLYIRPTNEKNEYILDNVLNVREKNERANQVLSALQVQLREDAEV